MWRCFFRLGIKSQEFCFHGVDSKSYLRIVVSAQVVSVSRACRDSLRHITSVKFKSSRRDDIVHGLPRGVFMYFFITLPSQYNNC